jgi:hypothetical protein
MLLPNDSDLMVIEIEHRGFALTPPDGGGIVAAIARCSVKIQSWAFLAVAIFACLGATPLLAHHGASVYDSSKLTTLKGTVTDFQFMNPHTEILFDVAGADGKIDKWTGEAPSLTTMSRIGWNKTIFKNGDQVTFIGNAAKSGSHIMRLREVVFPNGKKTVMDRGEDYAE